MSLRDPIIPPQVPLRLAPEVLDPVDVSYAPVSPNVVVHVPLAVIDPVVLEPRRVERVVDREAVGVDHRVGLDLLADDRQQRRPLKVRRDGGVDLPAALEDAEDDDLPGGSPASLALAAASEVALVDLDLPS